MSRAFVREDDEAGTAMPDRLVSGARNLVTARGLRLIEAEIQRWRADVARAQDDIVAARAQRELRYWTARRASAELVLPDADASTVMFGVAITIEDDQRRRRTLRIVGEDEAEPDQGRIPWPAPVARALMGRSIGETARLPTGEVEIVTIDPEPEA